MFIRNFRERNTSIMKKITLIPIALLLALLSLAQATDSKNTYVIRGNIVDHSTHESIKDVDVFLSKTTFNAISDQQGEYFLKNVLPGNYDMVFRAEGYEKLVVNVNISGSEVVEIDAFLLKEFTEENIHSSPEKIINDEWRENLEHFRSIFLGSSENAKSCEIINPEILTFAVDDKNQLSVSADEELQIINRALGYELNVTIKDFSWNLNSDTGYFLNLIQMNELKAIRATEASQWAANRITTYDQSLRKFLYTLTLDTPDHGSKYKISYDNAINNIGFDSFNRSASLFSSYAVKPRGIHSGKIVKVTDRHIVRGEFPESDLSNVHLFEIESNYNSIAVLPHPGMIAGNDIHIYWTSKKEMIHLGQIPTPESERLSFIGHGNDNDKKKYIAVDNYGILLNPLEVVVSGYWANDRIADFLPHNYHPVLRYLAATQ